MKTLAKKFKKIFLQFLLICCRNWRVTVHVQTIIIAALTYLFWSYFFRKIFNHEIPPFGMFIMLISAFITAEFMYRRKKYGEDFATEIRQIVEKEM